jgi:hypothetical protein
MRKGCSDSFHMLSYWKSNEAHQHSKPQKMKASYVYTDTFAGEANFSWARKGTVEANTVRGIIQKAKKEVGLTGCKTVKDNYGDTIAIKPTGSCTILFVDIEE